MSNTSKESLPPNEQKELLQILKTRFEKNMNRHKAVSWDKVEKKLLANPEKLYSLYQMEESGGEPDIVSFDDKTDQYTFVDCSPESPKGRRSICYDRESWEARKENKPSNNALEMASEMGIEILDEAAYRELQKLGNFDAKTSSWIKTPDDIRELDGALFGDYRYGKVFIYHNGASSYYAARGFRGSLKL